MELPIFYSCFFDGLSYFFALINLFSHENSSLLLDPDWLDLLNWIPLIWAFASFKHI